MDAKAEVGRAVRRQLMTGVSLLAGLALAVALAMAAQPGPAVGAAILGIAVLEGLAIVMVMMHLAHERSILAGLVILTLVQVLGLLIVPVLGHFDQARF